MAKKDTKAKVIEQDAGYFFPEFDIHVVAADEAKAKKLVKKYHGIDVDAEKAKLSDNNNS